LTKDAEQQEWKIGEKSAGYYTEERNLSYVLIKDGSHMVPYDKPMETLDMINRFMGVGDNKVNGVESSVGAEGEDDDDDDDDDDDELAAIPDPPVIENEELESPMDTPPVDNKPTENKNDDDSVPVDTKPTENKDDGSTEDSKPTGTKEAAAEEDGVLGRYAKNAGGYGGALVILVLFVAVGGCCYRYRTSHRRPWTSLWSQFKDKLAGSRAGGYQRPKFRLDDQDETNEL
jgi:carboxypeptidase D